LRLNRIVQLEVRRARWREPKRLQARSHDDSAVIAACFAKVLTGRSGMKKQNPQPRPNVVGMEFSTTGALICGHAQDRDYAVGIPDAFEWVLVRIAPSQPTTATPPSPSGPVPRRSLLAHLHKLVADGKVQVSRGGRYRLST
jgi:hypothetical protein